MAAGVIEASRRPPDHLLFNLTLAVVVVGIVAVFDASYVRTMESASAGNDAFYFLKRQALFACIGLLGMMGMARFGYWRLRRWAGPLLLVSIFLLLLVWVPGVGLVRNGAARWIGAGPIQLQPSELAKLSIILYLSAVLTRGVFDIRNFRDGLLTPLAVVAFIAVLIERQPDMGTAAILFLASLTMLYLAGARKRHLAAIVCAALLLAIAASFFGHSFRGGRLKVFLDPDAHYKGAGYQVSRGLVAVGSGGLAGVGIGAGREKFYIPEANTDFIFATIAEETGLIGSLLVVGLLFLIGRQAFLIARRTRDPFGSLLAAGIASLISWQALVNLAVVTGSVPATGVPLPFLSYGGSSVLILLIAIGILLNISQHPDAPGRQRH